MKERENKYKGSRSVWESYNSPLFPILKGYHVHHINKLRYDDRIENLECLSRKKHAKKHSIVIYKDKNNKIVVRCSICEKEKLIKNFKRNDLLFPFCNKCYNKFTKPFIEYL